MMMMMMMMMGSQFGSMVTFISLHYLNANPNWFSFYGLPFSSPVPTHPPPSSIVFPLDFNGKQLDFEAETIWEESVLSLFVCLFDCSLTKQTVSCCGIASIIALIV